MLYGSLSQTLSFKFSNVWGDFFSVEFHNTSKGSWKGSREEQKQSWKLQSMAGTLPARHLQKRGLELNQTRWIQLLIIREVKKTGSRKPRGLVQGTQEAPSCRLSLPALMASVALHLPSLPPSMPPWLSVALWVSPSLCLSLCLCLSLLLFPHLLSVSFSVFLSLSVSTSLSLHLYLSLPPHTPIFSDPV